MRINKWMMAVVVLALAYAVVLSLGLGDSAIHWDEVNHLNGPLLLIRGQIWDYAAINSYYPPLYNIVTAVYFLIAGASVFTARLVSLTFSVFLILLVYKTSRDMYSSKVGFVASLFFAVMPGIVLLSGLAMIETMLLFMVSFSLLFFFRWLQTSSRTDLSLSAVAFVLGAFVKYQALVVVPIIMLFSLIVMGKCGVIKAEFTRIIHSKRIWLSAALAVTAVIFLYEFYASGLLEVWIYAIQIGGVGQSEYSVRFPSPIFYFIEMVWPYADNHPVSLLLYLLGIAGLGFFAYRRKPQDKFLLVWFIVVYVVFTLIPNRQWRYVTLAFPVLAISAAELLTRALSKLQALWQSKISSASKKQLSKVAAGFLIVLTAAGVFYSVSDAYVWVTEDQIQVPTEEAVLYIASKSPFNGSVLLLCPFNRFNKDMVWFYLNSKSASSIQVYQYPTLAVDAYPFDFNVTQLVGYCQTNGTKFLLLYEYESTPTYYGSSLNEQLVYDMLNSTGKFHVEATFGLAPRRMYVFSFDASG
ncbi:MAG: ArnT family glycosyltransferase [Candidatus Bathyarchaeia archaeon]